jgi:flagellin-specific chaperone FliS
MNLSLARQHYSMTKESKIDGPSQNALAIKLAMEQLVNSLNTLLTDETLEKRENAFEIALSRIYILQKCLDFEAGGELAKNLFKTYEHARKTTTTYMSGKTPKVELEKTVSYIEIILEGWNEIITNE